MSRAKGTPVKRARQPTDRGQANHSKSKHAEGRFRPGQRALLHVLGIGSYQKSTNLLLRKLPFAQVIGDIAESCYSSGPLLWQLMAIRALQEAAEAHLVNLLEDADLFLLRGNRVIRMPKDTNLRDD